MSRYPESSLSITAADTRYVRAFPVADTPERLNLGAKVGDVSHQGDATSWFLLRESPASDDLNWDEIGNLTQQTMIFMGNFDPLTTGLLPGGGDARAGQVWRSTSIALVHGLNLVVGSLVMALVDAAAEDDGSDWNIL